MSDRWSSGCHTRSQELRRNLFAIALCVSAVNLPAWTRTTQGSAVPKNVQSTPAAQAAVTAAWRSEEERANARVHHGVWTEGDLADPLRRARAAIDAGIPNAVTTTATVPEGVPVVLAAEALVNQGQFVDALKLLTDLPGATAASLRATCFEGLGQLDEAAMAAAESVRDLADGKAIAVADLVMVAEAMQVLARVRATDAAACEAILKTLADARALDRLDWRGRVAEGRFLLEKHDHVGAVDALREALALNPRAAEAWKSLGEIALMGFDFDGAERAAEQIRLVADTVDTAALCAPAALLRAESACCRFDADEALAILAPIRAALPSLPQAIALEAVAHGLQYDFDAMRASLAAADTLAPGSGRAWLQAGRFLALARQYADAADLLSEAAKREPNWSVPRNELGLLQMQAGKDAEALAALTEAARLDPYDKRVEFSKLLLEKMAGWKSFHSEHFRVRCRAGVDEILAASMPAQLEVMYREVCDHYQHEPKVITTIELAPDHQHFAVRITGMPQIHTVAASTGPVIALEPPKEGGTSRSIGRFDWLDTIRHEFVHTVTLDRTSNRIPHWFTEAAAVDMERRARDWHTYQLLAETLQKGELFDLDGIKWAFVRPKQKQDRALAYAQGHWMVQFMRESYGKGAVVNLLDQYARGETEAKAFTKVLGITREQFMTDFKVWATAQVSQWGLAAEPSIDSLVAAKRSTDDPDAPLSDASVAEMLAANPTHPDVLEIAARRAVARAAPGGAAPGADEIDDTTADLLARYSASRPLDPWPRKRLVARSIARGELAAARDHLMFLDAREDTDPVFALEIARLSGILKDPKAALVAAERAARIDPYVAVIRDLAARCAVKAGDLDAARLHILALTMIEPERVQHQRQLERIDQLIAERSPPASAP